MYGIEIAESDHKLVLILDKDLLPREEIENTRRLYENSDANHIGYVSDEEQADLEAILNAMTDEDKEIVRTIYIEDDGKRN
jgi:hypothetical protein